MAKGRKLTTSRSERFLGTYAHAQSPAVATSELREEDIWYTAEDSDPKISGGDWEPRAADETNGGGGSYRIHHRIPRDGHRPVGGLSLAFEDPASNAAATPRVVHQFRARDGVAASPLGRHVASSAPVNVPDWSKILRVDSVESLHGADDDGFDESESEMVPPHEYLARSRKAAANSVFEGVGRTLKGRDLSRVRDAVWNQTGFYG